MDAIDQRRPVTESDTYIQSRENVEGIRIFELNECSCACSRISRGSNVFVKSSDRNPRALVHSSG